MATNTNLFSQQSNIINGLGTYTHTVVNAGIHFFECRSDVVPPSTLSITIAQSGSATVSANKTISSPTQSHAGIRQQFNCAAGDVLTLTLASSGVNDNQKNYGVVSTVIVTLGTGV